MALKTIKIRFEDMIDKSVSSPSFNSSSKFEFYIGIIFWKIKGNLFQLFTRMRYLLLSHKKLKTCRTILGLDFYMLSWKTISKFYWLKKEICDASKWCLLYYDFWIFAGFLCRVHTSSKNKLCDDATASQ